MSGLRMMHRQNATNICTKSRPGADTAGLFISPSALSLFRHETTSLGTLVTRTQSQRHRLKCKPSCKLLEQPEHQDGEMFQLLSKDSSADRCGEVSTQRTVSFPFPSRGKQYDPVKKHRARGSRSAIGRRIAQDIAIVRGAAERAIESMRLQVQAVVLSIVASNTAALGGFVPDWKPLGVFQWQKVANASDLNSSEIDRMRSLQRTKQKQHILQALRVHAFQSVVSVLASLKHLPDVVQRMGQSKIWLAPARNPLFAAKVSKTPQEEARVFSPSDENSQLGGLSFLRRRDESRMPSRHRSARISKRPARSHDLSVLPSELQNSSSIVDRTGFSACSDQSTSSKNMWNDARGPEAARRGLSRIPWIVTIGTGIFALGTGAVMGGMFTTVITAAASLVTATAVNGSLSRKQRFASPLALPGLRRSRLVRRLDEAIVGANNVLLQSARISSGCASLASKKTAHTATYQRDTVFSCLTPPTDVRYFNGDAESSDLCEVVTEDTVRIARSSSPVSTSEPIFSGENITEIHSAIYPSTSQSPAIAIDADSYAVLPSEPAIFSIPIFGSLLNFLDVTAYTAEQICSRVCQRFLVSWFPLVSGGWMLHPTLTKDEE